MDKRAYWVWLVMVFGPSNPRIWMLSREYESIEDFVDALLDNSTDRLSDDELASIQATPVEQADKVIAECERKSISIITYDDPDYPQRLREIYNPPAVLFCKGSIDALNDMIIIAVSGSREPSDYSRKLTDVITFRLGEKGCMIASGLMDGVDKLAAVASVGSGFSTLGITGTAVDELRGLSLADKVADNGCVISETCLALNSRVPRFRERNRVIAALIDAIIYIEGSASSKGLELCDSVLGYGKPVFVVPPRDIMDERYAGQIRLLRRGCHTFFNEKDVLFYLARGNVERFEYEHDRNGYMSSSDYAIMNDEAIDPDDRVSRSKIRKTKNPKIKRLSEIRDHDDLVGTQREICDSLIDGPQLADAVAEKLGMTVDDVLSELTMLELDGYVESLPGNLFGLL